MEQKRPVFTIPFMPNPKRSYLLLALFFISFMIYIPALKAPFFWDDYHRIPGLVDNPTVKYDSESRPMRKASFYVDALIWEQNPGGYHFTNLILNAIAVIMAFYFIRFFFKDDIFAFFVSVLFALHPMHVEAIAWIKNRTEPLAFIFFVLAFKAFFRWRWATYVFFVCALLAKQSAAVFPLILTSYLYIYGQKEKIRQTLPLWGIALVPLFISLRSLEKIVGVGQLPNLGIHVLTIVKTYAFYWYLIIFPKNFNIEWQLALSYRHITSLLSFIALALFFGAMYLSRKNKNLLFFLALFFISILPYSNIIFIAGRPWAEQRLYVPSLAFSVLLCMGAALKKEYTYMLFIIMLLFGYQTLNRARQWVDPKILWSEAKKLSPSISRSDFNMGGFYYEKGDYNKAKEHFIQAYEKEEGKSPLTLLNLGLVYMRQGDYKTAIESLKAVISMYPEYVPAYYNLGITYLESGDFPNAIANFEKARELEPNELKIYNNLAVAYKENKEPLKAIEVLKNILKIKPDYANARYNLVVIYKKSGYVREALEIVENELRQRPNDPVFLNFYKELTVGKKAN